LVVNAKVEALSVEKRRLKETLGLSQRASDHLSKKVGGTVVVSCL
jgi:hypothetical protein